MLGLGFAHGESGKTYTVSPGMSIQDILDKASPGDTVQVLPGVYVESLELATDGIVLRGMEYEGERAVLRAKDAQEDEPLQTGIGVAANRVVIEGIVVRGFSKLGIVVDNVTDLTIRDVLVQDCGQAGIALDDVTRATLDRVVVRGGATAAMNVTDSLQVSIAHSEAYDAAIGLSIMNSQQTRIESCAFHRNGAGVALQGTSPDEAETTSYTTILRCRLTDNRGVHSKLAGFGVAIAGALHTEIAESDIAGNGAMGIGVWTYDDGNDVSIPSQHTYVHDNRYSDNGLSASETFAKRFPGIPPGDLFWDSEGERNQFQESLDLKTYPENLVVEQGGVHTEVIHFL